MISIEDEVTENKHRWFRHVHQMIENVPDSNTYKSNDKEE